MLLSLLLLFFLLIGRFLDRKMRNHARATAHNLMSYRPNKATIVTAEGDTEASVIELLRTDMVVRVAPGERIPVDGLSFAAHQKSIPVSSQGKPFLPKPDLMTRFSPEP